MGHRLCGTNGSHAYGCLMCGKKDRYCQLFQLHHYGETIEAADNQKLKELLRARAIEMRAQKLETVRARLIPSPELCRTQTELSQRGAGAGADGTIPAGKGQFPS